jgi:hypothetical protein
MQKWAADNHYEQMDMCIEIEREFRVPEGVMPVATGTCRNWYPRA